MAILTQVHLLFRILIGRLSSTVRIADETHARLRELAASSGRPMQEILAEAVDAYARMRLLEETNAAYAALRADPGGWREELAERQAWEATLADNPEGG